MSSGETTKARLLEAAGEEFAAKGYKAASIRKICDRVGANCAAVNYHFGSKEQLYIEAVLEAHRCGTEVLPESVFREGTPAEQLRRYIEHFLGNVLAISRENTWHQALMLREMIQPTAASEILVREAIRPRFERLLGILRRVCPAAEPRKLLGAGVQRGRPVLALSRGAIDLGAVDWRRALREARPGVLDRSHHLLLLGGAGFGAAAEPRGRVGGQRRGFRQLGEP